MMKNDAKILVIVFFLLLLSPIALAGDAPVAVRAEMLTVTPATGPVTYIQVRNLTDAAFDGQISVKFPAGWKINRPTQPITVAAGQTLRVAFAIEKGVNSARNSYPLAMTVSQGAKRWEFKQTIVCASAPFLEITVDGKHEDWKDSIPVTFETAGKRTVIRTAYTQKNFFLLVGVEEDAHKPAPAQGMGEFDAIQIAIAPRDAVSPRKETDPSQRLELLFTARESQGVRWFRLAAPNDLLKVGAINLMSRELAAAPKVSFTRKDGWSWYEIALPVKSLPGIEPDPGREFCFSLLVHDPDGTGLRDWGRAAGMWPPDRKLKGWVEWEGSRRPPEGMHDSTIEWGFCSSAQ